ncbi:hypothetical protein ACIQBJ_07735 [Kitasatospora sp. NPDC088391]|uniref:hypothetical protein n=1 Tax=Kitasatospora sp. NPDC088391 TaxID=3364074 RepID=UPI003821D638
MDVEEMLDRLGTVLGPPPEGGVAPVPWELGPGVMGFQLPLDYRAFVDRYGSVSISGELHVRTPSGARGVEADAPLGFEGFLYGTTNPYGYCAWLAEAHRDGDHEECPYPLFPAEHGLLRWGNNYNSDYFFWLMRGPDPDRWPVAARFHARQEWDLFEGGFLAFLLATVSERYPYHGAVLPGGVQEVEDGRSYRLRGDWARQLPW